MNLNKTWKVILAGSLVGVVEGIITLFIVYTFPHLAKILLTSMGAYILFAGAVFTVVFSIMLLIVRKKTRHRAQVAMTFLVFFIVMYDSQLLFVKDPRVATVDMLFTSLGLLLPLLILRPDPKSR